MSTPKHFLCRNRHNFEYTDRNFSESVADVLRAFQISPQQVSRETGIHYERVRSWFNDRARISARDFVLVSARYDFFAEVFDSCYVQRENAFIVAFHS